MCLMSEQTQLCEIAKRMKASIEIKDRRQLLRTYHSTFVGTDAVVWMLKAGVAQSIREAEMLGML